MVWRQWRRRMLEQASERGLLSGSGALLRGRRLGRSATDRQRAPRMAFLRGPSRPPISAPFPQMDSSLCLSLSLSLGVSDYSARIKSGLPCFNARARAGSGNPGPACLSAYLGRARCLVIEPFPLQFPNSQAAGVKMKRRRRRNGMSVGEEDGDFFSKFALMTPPS